MNNHQKEKIKSILDSYGVLLVLIVAVLISTAVTDKFLNLRNITDLFRRVSIIGILAIGQTYVILTSGIDLSSGSILAVSIVIIAGFIGPYGLIPAILIGILVSIVLGLVNGAVIAYGKVPAFIMTLGMLSFARGLAYLYTGGTPIQIHNQVFSAIGNGYFLGIPIPVYIYLALMIIFSFILKKTPFGRSIYAIGSNQKAAKIAGVPVNKFLLIAYIISGMLAGVGGLLYASQLGLGTPVAGRLYELDAIAAVVVGGTALSGGKGHLWGTFVGVLIIGVMTNVFNLTGVDIFVQELVKGLVIIGAVLLRRKAFES